MVGLETRTVPSYTAMSLNSVQALNPGAGSAALIIGVVGGPTGRDDRVGRVHLEVGRRAGGETDQRSNQSSNQRYPGAVRIEHVSVRTIVLDSVNSSCVLSLIV